MAADSFKGRVQWCGEHWINYIRRPGATDDRGGVSLYHTRHSEAGEGTVAFVLIPEAEIDVTYTDNRDLAQWTCQTMIRGGGNQFDHDMPVEDAALGRQGDVRENPSWCIESKDHTIESTWTVEEPAVIYWGPAPSRTSNLQIFSLLYFTWATTLTIDGQAIDGTAYPRDIWRTSIGGDRSSCVFALAETLIEV